jgi:uncharacterized membrane protein YdjX (TVP38/TMEM64 family)
VCAAAALVASSGVLHSELIRVLAVADAMIARHPAAGALLFVALAAISATLAFFSSAVIVPVAVYAWGETTSALLLWLGWMIGGAAAYGIGRLLGRPVVAALTSAAALSRFEQRISRRASPGAVLLLQLALPSEVPGYVLGLAHYGLARYLAVLAVAELPYAVGTVFLGAAFLERRTPVVLALGGAALLVGAVALAINRRRARSARAPAAPSRARTRG